jgi:serine/threonine protein kinase
VVIAQIDIFARKIFMSGERAGAKEWFKSLLANRINHGHLMSALGAYNHGNIFFILFEAAETSLADYLKSDGTRFTPAKLWNEVQGLADGLAHLSGGSHGETIIYHRDLKPSNVLIVKGTMKIADFGLLEYKRSPLDEPSSSGTYVDNATLEYAAPRENGERFDHWMDVWSLGAMASEIATFDILKAKGIVKYRSDRQSEVGEGTYFLSKSFHIKGTNKIKQSVLEMHQKLLRQVNESDRTENRNQLCEFQKCFYREALFKMIEGMLQNENNYFTANRVASLLKQHYQDACTAVKDMDQPNRRRSPEDIWEEMKSGKISNSPANANFRLEVNRYFPE